MRHECLDRLLVVGRQQLHRVLTTYIAHYNSHRPHRSLDLLPPDGLDPIPAPVDGDNVTVLRRDLLGGLIHEY